MKILKGDKVLFVDNQEKKWGIVIGSVMGLSDILARDGRYSKADNEILEKNGNVFDDIDVKNDT